MANAAKYQAAQTQLAALGIDWSKLDLTKIFEIIRLLIDLFSNQPKPMMATDAKGCATTCKAHFEAITALSECGASCCDTV